MPNKRRFTEPLIIKTISIPASYLDWVKNNTDRSFSDFVRNALDEKIGNTTGFKEKLAAIEEDIRQKRAELEALSAKKFSIEQEQEIWEEAREIEELSSLIVKAINKLNYASWEDAARDLDSSRKNLSSEAFRDLVQSLWIRTKIDGAVESVPNN